MLEAYDCVTGCVSEAVWGWEYLDRSIINKFTVALTGCLVARGYKEGTYSTIVEPEQIASTRYVVLDETTGEIILMDSYKPWHFGHKGGSLVDLEKFFSKILPVDATEDATKVYRVNICRTSTRCMCVDIEADSLTDADAKAKDMAGNLDFTGCTEHDSSYDVEVALHDRADAPE